jgi:hypothetical protein
MDYLDLNDTGQPHERTVKVFGNIEFTIRYTSPIEADRFRAALTRDGIARHTRDLGFQVNPGREMSFYKATAERYVIGWKNVKVDGEIDPPYDAGKMAEFMARVGPVLSAIKAAVEDEDGFFETNGGPSPKT